MTYDESNAQLTDRLTGKVVDHVERVGKELHFVLTDGHTVVIQSDVNGDIHFKKQNVSIQLPSIQINGFAGKL